MPYKILNHTADIKIHVKGSSLENLFTEAFNALMQIIGENSGLKNTKKITREVSISSLDTTSLLVDFLNEVLLLSQINKEIYNKCIIKNLSKNSLRAQIVGFSTNKFSKDIKAVTYHEANVKQSKNGFWETNLVFDI